MATLIRGAIVAGAVALAIVLSTALGLPSPWPVLLTAGVALVRPVRPGPVVALLLGAAAWWLAMALRAGVLPDSTVAAVLAAVAAVAVTTVAAAATRGWLPLWAGLAGSALFAGVYEPVFADSPTTFLADSPLAFASVVVAIGIGALAGALVGLVERGAADTSAVSTPEGVA